MDMLEAWIWDVSLCAGRGDEDCAVATPAKSKLRHAITIKRELAREQDSSV
jgi:hypothetical protein